MRLPHLHIHDVGTGDSLAWESRGLAHIDARLKVALTGFLVTLNLFGGWAVSLGLLLMSLALLLLWQRIRPQIVLLRLVPPLLVAGMLIVLRGFTEPGRALLTVDLPRLAPARVTVQGLASGAELGLVVLGGVSVVLLLGLTTPLPKLLAALRSYRVPPLLIELGMLMYRYLFLVVEEGARMRQAQRLRGPRVSWSRAMGGFSNIGALLLVRSYERSQRVYDAQRLRGGIPVSTTGPRPGPAGEPEAGGPV
jgi:cobalt/nickel transport system permease protein